MHEFIKIWCYQTLGTGILYLAWYSTLSYWRADKEEPLCQFWTRESIISDLNRETHDASQPGPLRQVRFSRTVFSYTVISVSMLAALFIPNLSSELRTAFFSIMAGSSPCLVLFLTYRYMQVTSNELFCPISIQGFKEHLPVPLRFIPLMWGLLISAVSVTWLANSLWPRSVPVPVPVAIQAATITFIMGLPVAAFTGMIGVKSTHPVNWFASCIAQMLFGSAWAVAGLFVSGIF